jgi:hypothetical protein
MAVSGKDLFSRRIETFLIYTNPYPAVAIWLEGNEE